MYASPVNVLKPKYYLSLSSAYVQYVSTDTFSNAWHEMKIAT